jgi:hypothetical protein
VYNVIAPTPSAAAPRRIVVFLRCGLQTLPADQRDDHAGGVILAFLQLVDWNAVDGGAEI